MEWKEIDSGRKGKQCKEESGTGKDEKRTGCKGESNQILREGGKKEAKKAANP